MTGVQTCALPISFCAHIGIQKKEEKKEEKKEVCCVLCARYKIVGAGFLRPRADEQWMLLQVAIGKKMADYVGC